MDTYIRNQYGDVVGRLDSNNWDGTRHYDIYGNWLGTYSNGRYNDVYGNWLYSVDD